MKRKASSKIWNVNIRQKAISKKIDHVCIVFCLVITLITAILECKKQKESGNQDRLHGGRTVI